MESGWEHGSVVPKEGVAGAQEKWEVGKCMVRKRAGSAVDDQQARSVAASGGSLRDQMSGQVVVEKIGGERRHDGENEACPCKGGEFLPLFASLSADIAQLVEQLIRNEQVIGSSPIVGSSSPEIADVTV